MPSVGMNGLEPISMSSRELSEVGKYHERQDWSWLVQTAEADPLVRCWWCDSRPLNRKWQADHICPTQRDSPVIVACQRCNRLRQSLVPTMQQWQRLQFGEDHIYLRSVSGAMLFEWIEARAKSLWPDGPEQTAKDCLVAKVWYQPIRLQSRGKKIYGRMENKLWEQKFGEDKRAGSPWGIDERMRGIVDGITKE